MDQREASRFIESLFSDWGPHLVRYAYRLTCDREAADDLVQESFLALYRACRGGMQIENPRAWTLAVVRRLAAMRRRDQVRHGEVLTAPETLELLEDPQPLPDAAEEPDALDLLRVLSKREQEVVLMRIEGRKYREIASSLGIRQRTVETLLARALKKFRKAAACKQQGRVVLSQKGEHVRKTLQ
jgi:RNA polymerase sigma-70 factor (ECF subfamily)